MKKTMLIVLALCSFALCNAQSVIDADNTRNPNDFYQKGLVVGKKAVPFPYLRESDVVWKTTIWRDIDFNETFNQFFYFPTEETSTQNRISLVRLIVRSIADGKITHAYADDDMKEEMDIEQINNMLAGPGGDKRRVKKDENGEEMYDEELEEYVYETYHEDGVFDTNTVTKIRLKEFWYIDKQDTRQKVRIVGLMFQFIAPGIESAKGETLVEGGPRWSFCIPMNEMDVRNILVNANAYEASNDVAERSYDDIFIQRYFDSYIVRESNTHNRAIEDYLTGEDAILQSQSIENKIFDIESDMWEY